MARPKKRFYVYLIRDPRPGKRKVPIYVGKGNRDRAFRHVRRNATARNPMLAAIIVKCRARRCEPPVKIVARFETEAEAFRAEKALILKYGRRDLGTGTLCNLTNGGEGASGSLAISAAASARLKRLWSNPAYRKRMSADSSIRLRRLHTDPKYLKRKTLVSRRTIRRLNADPAFQQLCTLGLRRLNADPKFRRKKLAWLQRLWADPEFRTKWRAAMRRVNGDPKFQKRRMAAVLRRWDDPEFRRWQVAIRRANMRRLLADPKFRKRHTAIQRAKMLRLNADPEFRKRSIEGLRRQIATDPGYRKRKSAQGRASIKKLWADPDFVKRKSAITRAVLKRRYADPQFMRRHSARMCERNADPAFQVRRLAATSPSASCWLSHSASGSFSSITILRSLPRRRRSCSATC
jgi:hypothetical protein